MNVSPDDFRRYYDNLSDHALLDIKRDELTEVAQLVYDQELSTRGLAKATPRDAPEAAPAPEIESDAEMVVAAEFDQLSEARLAMALLQGSEIPCTINEDQANGFRLLVPAQFEEQALTILMTPLSDEELEAQAEAAGNSEED